MTTPLHSLSLSRVTLLEDQALPLLHRQITLYFGEGGNKTNHVITTVWQIYKKCQESLSEEFGKTKLCITGSSVSHLFSHEPFGDIDIHGTIAEEHLIESQRISRGYGIQWAILKGISEIISKHFTPTPMDAKMVITSKDILYEEKNTIMCSSGSVFNVHTIRLPGKFPVEFTIFNVIKPVLESVRNYDFNSGSLQLSIEEDGAFTLESRRLEIWVTMEEIARRELTCDTPGEIRRKATCRYLAKLLLSGYFDKEKELLPAIVNSVKKRFEEKKQDPAIAKGIVDEIIVHFQGKGIHPLAPLLFLWLQGTDDPFLKMVIALAKQQLKNFLMEDPLPHRQALLALVQNGKKAECCWYLTLQALACRKVLHREVDSLSLQIPSFPMFADKDEGRAVFFIVPIHGLEMFSQTVIPKAFLDLQDNQIQIQFQEKETKVLLQKLFEDLQIKSPSFPLISAVIYRFAIDNPPNFTRHFLHWIKTVSEEELQKIPLWILSKVFQEIKEGDLEDEKLILSLLKRLYTLVSKEGIFSFENVALQRIITYYTFLFLRGEKWGRVSHEHQGIIFDFAKAHVKKFCNKDKLLAYQKSGDSNLCRRTLNLLCILYVRKQAHLEEIIQGVRLSAELGSIQQSFKFLDAIAQGESSLENGSIQDLQELLSESDPLEYVKFLKQNKAFIKEKMSAMRLVIEPFLKKLSDQELSKDLISSSVDLVQLFCTEEDIKKITKILFFRAANENVPSTLLLDELADRLSFSCLYFDWISEMDTNELNLLTQKRGFAESFENNPDYTMEVFQRALFLMNFPLAIQGSFHLATTDPLRGLLTLELLNKKSAWTKDFTVLLGSLKNLVRILDLDPSVRREINCEPIVQYGLEALSKHLEPDEKGDIVSITEPVFTNLQAFHRHIAIYNIECSAWPLLWQIVEKMGRNTKMNDWINLDDLKNTLPKINPEGNLDIFISFFDPEGPFVYEFLRVVSTFSKDRQKEFAPLVFDLIKRGSLSLLATTCKEPPPEAKEVVIFLRELINCFQFENRSADFDNQIEFFSFWAAYCDKGNEIQLLASLDMLNQEKHIEVRSSFNNKIHPGKILFLLARHAMERKDLTTLSKIRNYYFKWLKEFVIFDPNLCYEDIDSLSNEWKIFLDWIFLNSTVYKNFTYGAESFLAVDFYAMYLADAIKKYPASLDRLTPSEAKIKEVRDSRILELIHFVTRKKLFKLIYYLIPLTQQAKDLDPKSLKIFISRFFNMALELLGEIEKAPIQQDDLKLFSILSTLLKELILLGESSGERLVNRTSLIKILEKMRVLLPSFKGKIDYIQNSFTELIFLHGFLNKQEMIPYHHNWGQSILERQETVDTGEFKLWITLSFMLNSKTGPEMFKGIFQNSFSDKFFINRDYFTNKHFINCFINLINLGFKKLYKAHEEEKTLKETLGDMLNATVFNIFENNYHFIGDGIVNIIKKSYEEGVSLQKFYINTLLDYLKVPKSTCHAAAISALWRFIFVYNEEEMGIGVPFGLTFPEVVNIMYWMIHNLSFSDREKYENIQTIVHSLMLGYEGEKEEIRKILSSEQITELEEKISILFKPDPIATKVIGGKPLRRTIVKL